jgi:predicted ArsR family transcriptional regulator
MDWLEAVGDQDLRAAYSVVLAHPRPVTADELAASQGIHRNVARSRLERLADAGLLTRASERRTGRAGPGAGRPAKTYAPAPEPRPIEFPERHRDKLLALVIDSLPRNARRERLRALGAAFADELLDVVRLRPVKTLAAGAERMCEAVRQLGFHAAVAEVRDGVAVIETATCPLRSLVRHTSAAAELDRGMWAQLAARSLDGFDPSRIGCETDSCHGTGACRVTLTVRPSDSRK